MFKIIRIFLFPFSLLYGVVMAVRNVLFSMGILKSESYTISVISVGNITVGGTGKTPHTEYVINLLKKKHDIAVLSRGYGRKTKGFVEVTADSLPEQCGDEPCQMKRKFPDQTVIVDENRREGISELMKRFSPDVVLLDDAYQHRWVKPGLSILLIDYGRPIFSDFVMPTGALREFPAGSQRADVVVVTKCPSSISKEEEQRFYKKLNIRDRQHLFFSTYAYGDVQAVFAGGVAQDFIDKNVLLLTGIANPKPLEAYLTAQGAHVSAFPFPDHYQFTAKDMADVVTCFDRLPHDKRCIITTEKDAVRLKAGMDIPIIIKQHLYFIPIAVELLEHEQEFHQIIKNYVTKN